MKRIKQDFLDRNFSLQQNIEKLQVQTDFALKQHISSETFISLSSVKECFELIEKSYNNIEEHLLLSAFEIEKKLTIDGEFKGDTRNFSPNKKQRRKKNKKKKADDEMELLDSIVDQQESDYCSKLTMWLKSFEN